MIKMLQWTIFFSLLIISTMQKLDLNLPHQQIKRLMEQQKINFNACLNRSIGSPCERESEGIPVQDQRIKDVNQRIAFYERQLENLRLNLSEQIQLVNKYQNNYLQIQKSFFTLQNTTKNILKENTELKINQTNHRNQIASAQNINNLLQINLTKVNTEKTYFQKKLQQAIKQINILQNTQSKSCPECPNKIPECPPPKKCPECPNIPPNKCPQCQPNKCPECPPPSKCPECPNKTPNKCPECPKCSDENYKTCEARVKQLQKLSLQQQSKNKKILIELQNNCKQRLRLAQQKIYEEYQQNLEGLLNSLKDCNNQLQKI